MAPGYLVTAVVDRVARRCGDTHLGEASQAVKPFFAVFFQKGPNPAGKLGLAGLRGLAATGSGHRVIGHFDVSAVRIARSSGQARRDPAVG